MPTPPLPLSEISWHEFLIPAHGQWNDRWFLLTAGDLAGGHYNTMTVSWGAAGVLWGKPFAMVVVRPQRFTFQFMERYAHFTLCAFSSEYRHALELVGTRSGRDGDKVAAAHLHPVAGQCVGAPVFEEAELVLECRKLYWQDLDPTHFLDPLIQNNYPNHDYHRAYYGEVMQIRGIDRYRLT